MAEGRDRYREAVSEIVAAIRNEGVSPRYHQKTMHVHRLEWPALWRAIDKAMELYDADSRRK